MDYYYKKELKFPHKFIMENGRNRDSIYKQRKEVLDWIRENSGKYNKDYIYWGLKDRKVEPRWLDSAPEIQFKTKEYAAMFKLRWM